MPPALPQPAAGLVEGQQRADHELRRNMILSAGASYEYASYFTQDRHADVVGGDFTARWLIDRRLRTDFSVIYRTRDSNADGLGTKYDSLVATVGITAAL